MLKEQIDSLLDRVQKPARYMGGEMNCVLKDPNRVDIRYTFAFPDVYEVGMSHLGSRILYDIINKREDALCERVFMPWVDMADLMRQEGVPLFSLETRSPVGGFDMLGFTLQYEMSYTNILEMLDLSGIPLRSEDRTWEHPIVIAGGKKLPENEALELAYKAISSGARGVDMGRNIFQAENPAAMLEAVKGVVHGGLKPAEAGDMYKTLSNK